MEQIFNSTGISDIVWQNVVMWAVVAVLLYLAVHKKFEPLLLVPIALGALLANLPTEGIMEGFAHFEAFAEGGGERFELRPDGTGGLFYYLFQGIHLEIFPPLIFLGVGALTDFGPLIANPRMLLLGAAAQFGVFFVFIVAYFLPGVDFTAEQCGAIGIIGGADGPTAIFIANRLAPELLGAIAVSAYSYMAMVPIIQPPIMRALTNKQERAIRMKSLRNVSRLEKMVFAILVMTLCIIIVPAASPLLFMLFLGNFMRECGVVDRLVRSAQNELINIVTILLGTSVGVTMNGVSFLTGKTLGILFLGVFAFGVATAAGVLMAKVMNKLSPDQQINPLIGSAGVSAVPMAARVSQVEGQKEDPGNFLLMHAMGPNVAGVIGTALVAGFFISVFG
ncbi:MAG: sodium ion-translocating decarboxylase subunit beta [Opitutales bacterium]